jgi:CheY-like chemotaxis protein
LISGSASPPTRELQDSGESRAKEGGALAGARILLIEDDYFLAYDLRNELVERGAQVIGPYGKPDLALDLAKSTRIIDAAVVDVNLHGEFSFHVVDELIKRDVPVVYWTAYDGDVVPYRHRHITRFRKPLSTSVVAQGLAQLIADRGAAST